MAHRAEAQGCRGPWCLGRGCRGPWCLGRGTKWVIRGVGDQMGYHKEVWILESLLKKILQFRAELHQESAFLMLCNDYV